MVRAGQAPLLMLPLMLPLALPPVALPEPAPAMETADDDCMARNSENGLDKVEQ